MAEHVPETCNESSGTWLPLTEYSVKSGVSLSTIRRKIKSNSIPHRLENGRYLVLYREKGNPPVAQLASDIFEGPAWKEERGFLPSRREAESIQMLEDAYEHALRQKDERIRLLERTAARLQERIEELRLLVRVLEEKYEVRY